MPLYWATHALADAAARTAAFDAVELVPATGMIKVRRVCVWQTTDLGDAAEEVLRAEWIRGFTTSGSGGVTTVTTPLNPFDTASTLTTAELLNATVATTGTGLSLAVMGWNIRIPLDVLYPPGEEICARAGTSTQERIVFRIQAPVDSITVSAACLFEQL